MTASAINPLHPDTRAWLSDLYATTAARLFYAGAPLDAARAAAKTCALSLRDALLAGDLIDMEPNVVLWEMRAGITPEEFR